MFVAKRLAWIALAIGLAIAVQSLAEATLSNYIIRVASVCVINVMLAVALNLVNGTTGQFSIGHAGFMAVGAYAASLTSVALDRRIHGVLPGFAGDTVTLITAMIAGMLAAGTAGVVVGVPSLRLRGDYLAIVTLGFGEIIRISVESSPSIGGSQGFPLGVQSIPAYAKLGWLLIGALIAISLTWNLTYSSHGRALAAIREDEIAAEAVGVDTTRYKVLAFAVSAMITGLAGALYAHDATGGQHIDPGAFRLDRSIDILVMVIFGGLGSITGAIVGGLFVGILLELLKELPNLLGDAGGLGRILRDNAGNVRLIIYALALILLMLLRPQGLLGNKEFRLSKLFGRFRRGKTA